MALTARDTEMLGVVNRHRFLRSHHIAELIGGSRQQILRSLQRLCLDVCPALENVDALQSLTRLRALQIHAWPKLPAFARAALRPG